MIISTAKFRHYQEVFYKKICKVPFTVDIEIFSVTSSPVGEFSVEAFVGDSVRTSKTYSFRALYEREIPARVREKYGLPKEVNGIIYLSPIALVQQLGDFRLDWNKTVIHFAGRSQVIQKIEYLEPLYNSCIGVQIFLKDTQKGG